MGIFMTTEWRNLAMVTYEVDPAILAPYTPRGLEIDLFQDKAHVSLIGFEFLNTRIKKIPMPFHKKFIEMNLRFYVKNRAADVRGVCFIKEVVPKRLAAMTARMLYNEPFVTRPMCHHISNTGAAYSILEAGKWCDLIIRTDKSNLDRHYSSAPFGTIERFLVDRDWGFCKTRKGKTSLYNISHNRWDILNGTAEVRGFDKFYGPEFHPFLREAPVSSFVINGSRVSVGDRVTV